MRGSVQDRRFWVRQADEVLTQVNPASGQQYPVGVFAEAQRDARIIGIYAESTGGTVSSLQVHVALDGVLIVHNQTPPVSGTPYFAQRQINVAENAQIFDPGNEVVVRKAFLHEGKSIEITAEVTWTVQPTPLECRVKWEKYE